MASSWPPSTSSAIGARPMRLDVEQVPAAAQDGRGVDHARALLVGRHGSAEPPDREAVLVVPGDLRERVRRDVVQPHLAQRQLVADVFLGARSGRGRSA